MDAKITGAVYATKPSGVPSRPVDIRRVYSTWWPLAASWLFMGTELPVVSAAIARLPNPEINLAAYGGIVFALALLIEAPIIQLLAASTALSRDKEAYRKLYRFMMWAGGALSVLHVLIAFTPLYEFVVIGLIGAPADIVGPARIGLQILTPWTWLIAYRRFNQGVLIRYGHTRTVGLGTAVRLSINLIFLIAGFLQGSIPGIVVGTTAVIAGVASEALYVGIRVQPIVRNELPAPPSGEETLTYRTILDFYIPLALTSLLFLLIQPLGSAALSRMPDPIRSLAVWPVLGGLTFMVRSLGIAYNEVVVALLDETRSAPALRRFTGLLAFLTTLIMLLLLLTPLSAFWFIRLSGLTPELAELAEAGLWVVVLWPALETIKSWYQGALVHSRLTRGIPEAVVVFLATAIAILLVGVTSGELPGIFVGLVAFVCGTLTQILWLWFRSRAIREAVFERDQVPI